MFRRTTTFRARNTNLKFSKVDDKIIALAGFFILVFESNQNEPRIINLKEMFEWQEY